jgi:hypothetical protein
VTLGLSLAPCAREAPGIARHPSERITLQIAVLGFIGFSSFLKYLI